MNRKRDLVSIGKNKLKIIYYINIHLEKKKKLPDVTFIINIVIFLYRKYYFDKQIKSCIALNFCLEQNEPKCTQYLLFIHS